jgi:hypothetical protein
MRITIDLEEFWTDEECLSDALKHAITANIIREVMDKIEAKAVEEIRNTCVKVVDEFLEKKISLYIDEEIRKGEIKSSRNSSNKVPIHEYIRERFEYGHGWNSFDDKIKKLTTQFSNEMKERYDLLFASQLVAKMGNSGMLKEDVAKLLLNDKQQK